MNVTRSELGRIRKDPGFRDRAHREVFHRLKRIPPYKNPGLLLVGFVGTEPVYLKTTE